MRDEGVFVSRKVYGRKFEMGMPMSIGLMKKEMLFSQRGRFAQNCRRSSCGWQARCCPIYLSALGNFSKSIAECCVLFWTPVQQAPEHNPRWSSVFTFSVRLCAGLAGRTSLEGTKFARGVAVKCTSVQAARNASRPRVHVMCWQPRCMSSFPCLVVKRWM